MPLAYSKLFDVLDYPIMILNDSMDVIKANAIARRAFSDKMNDKGYISLNELCNDTECINKIKNNEEYIFKKIVDSSLSYYSVKLISLYPWHHTKNRDYGFLLVFNDVTDHVNQVHDLEIAASVDPLTGSNNMRRFHQMAKDAAESVRKKEEPLSVIMIDIDHFKRINDKYGHQAGDQILKSVVGVVKSQLRESDIFARYGGKNSLYYCRRHLRNRLA